VSASTADILVAQQKNPPLSPAQIVDRFLEAKEGERWSEAVGYLDLRAIDVLRQAAIRIAGDSSDMGPWTIERMMKFDPKMPRAVAEYHVQQMQKEAADLRRRTPWASEFVDVSDINSLRSLNREKLGESWVKTHDPRYIAMRNGSGCDTVALRKAIYAAGKRMQFHSVVGQVVNDSVAYVLNEDSAGGSRRQPLLSEGVFIQPEVFVLRKVGGEWKIFPSAWSSNVFAVSTTCAPSKAAASPAR
jgi:hypothetical protein